MQELRSDIQQQLGDIDWKLQYRVTDRAYDALKKHRGDFISWYKSKELLKLLCCGAVQRDDIPCCINSCEARTGSRSTASNCLHCNEPFFFPDGKPRQFFTRYPLTHRLAAQWRNPARAEQLLYRHRATKEYDESVARGEDVVISDYIQAARYQEIRPFLSTKYTHLLSLALDGFECNDRFLSFFLLLLRAQCIFVLTLLTR